MGNKKLIFAAAMLLALNYFAWQEVFDLQGERLLKVYFLDIGQGDAEFIQTPGMHQILIDGGPDSKILSKLQVLMPFWDKTIDVVVLTHPERDHMAGLMEALQRYKADYILWTGMARDTVEYEKWVELLKKKQAQGAKIIIVSSGQKVAAGKVFLGVLHPVKSPGRQEAGDSSNDSSIVLRLDFGQKSFLFAGDISSKTENELLQGSALQSDVLKVAHHGSKHSTTEDFLERVGPEIAVISAGENNSYGHPAQEVLQRLNKFGITVKRTDQDGDIGIESDGKNIYIK